MQNQLTWKGLGENFANAVTMGAYGSAQTLHGAYNLAKNVPNYTGYDYIYGAGFVAEKIAEAAVFKRVTSIAGRVAARGIVVEAEAAVSTEGGDLVRVRHHTNRAGLSGIKNSGSVNASRGIPYGVDVEVAPFLKPASVNVGQYGRGSFVEFSIPKSQLSNIPSYMGGTGNVARIVTEGGAALDISSSSARYVKWNWLGF